MDIFYKPKKLYMFILIKNLSFTRKKNTFTNFNSTCRAQMIRNDLETLWKFFLKWIDLEKPVLFI